MSRFLRTGLLQCIGNARLSGLTHLRRANYAMQHTNGSTCVHRILLESLQHLTPVVIGAQLSGKQRFASRDLPSRSQLGGFAAR